MSVYDVAQNDGYHPKQNYPNYDQENKKYCFCLHYEPIFYQYENEHGDQAPKSYY